MEYGHLERFDLTLRVLSPVFIGSGGSLTKKEYIYERDENRIYIVDLARLVKFLSGENRLESFQRFLLSPQKNDLRSFLKDEEITKAQYPAFVLYELDPGEISASEKFRGILMFMKGPDGLPYIPGSSIKGAIRTAIASKLIKLRNNEADINSIETAAEKNDKPKWYIKNETIMLENKLFCKLGITDPVRPDRLKWNDIVNDFMRGVRISDSAPLGFENITICGKFDRKPDGYVNDINIYRECLRPGTEVHFELTLEKPVMAKAGISKEFITAALREFAVIHRDSFEKSFRTLEQDADIADTGGADIIIGGGSGYAAKTLVYPLIGDRGRAVNLVGKIMMKQFPKHFHIKDSSQHKVSPHMLKTTRYDSHYYHMGRCQLIINDFTVS